MSHDQLATDLRTVKSKLLEAQQHHGTASTLIAEALGTLESCMLRLERDSQSAPAHPATAHQLGGELAAAALADDGDPQGHDISGGLFGPNVSEWLRKFDIERATAREQAIRANATTRDLMTVLDQIAKAASATVCNPGWIAKHATAATQRAKDQPSEQA